MTRIFRIIILLMLIVTLWGTVRNQDQCAELEEKMLLLKDTTTQEFDLVSDWSYGVNINLSRMEGSIDDLIQPVFDVAVLDSCGIITDGYGWGSCVAIGPNLIMTAGHCIGFQGGWVEVLGTRYEIIEEWASDTYDVGFCRIDGELSPIVLGPMPTLFEDVYLIGVPYDRGLINTVTRGVISCLSRDIWEWQNLIQTDAEGAPGSSGGPLINKYSEIIGICVTGMIPGGGITLCVPIEDIQTALKDYNADTLD